MNNFETEQVIREAFGDPNIRGFFRDNEGRLMLDRRASDEMRELYPRNFDLNLMGSEIIPVPAQLASELGL